MSSDYCIDETIFIEYLDNSGISKTMCIHQKHKNIKIKKKYDSCRKYVKYVSKKCKKYSYQKILYENMEWISEKCKLKYEKYLRKWYPETKDFIKVYKKSAARPCY